MLAHRALAVATQEGVKDLEEGDNVGFVLASNMNAGFAIELGLKAFYMTFHSEGPPATHDLLKLYSGLPSHIREAVDARYRTKVVNGPPIRVYAFKFSVEDPDVPEEANRPVYTSAEACLAGCSNAFVRSRYFFEAMTDADWSIVDNPIFYMTAMVDALDEAYEEAVQLGS
jgi:HEPN domain-containing protein